MAKDMRSGFSGMATAKKPKTARNAVKEKVKQASKPEKKEKTKLRVVGVDRIIDTNKVVPNNFNYKAMSPFHFDKLKENIKRLGFVVPVIVRTGNENGPFEDGHTEIVDGYHRWKAATDLGLKQIKVTDLGNCSEKKAKTLIITLNELHGKADPDKLADLVSELNQMDASLVELLPYDESEIEGMLDTSDEDWDSLDESGKGSAEEDDGEEEAEEEEGLMEMLGIDLMSEKSCAKIIVRLEKLQSKVKLGEKPGALLRRLVKCAELKYGIVTEDEKED